MVWTKRYVRKEYVVKIVCSKIAGLKIVRSKNFLTSTFMFNCSIWVLCSEIGISALRQDISIKILTIGSRIRTFI